MRYALYKPFNRALRAIVKPFEDSIVLVDDGTLCDTLEKITNLYHDTGYIHVWTGATDNNIFGNALDNYRFRAWHDLIHIMYQFPFTQEGERAVCAVQKEQIKKITNDSTIQKLLDIEVNGQVEYYYTHNIFPANQLEFTINKMKGN